MADEKPDKDPQSSVEEACDTSSEDLMRAPEADVGSELNEDKAAVHDHMTTSLEQKLKEQQWAAKLLEQ
eukprot:gene12881-15222_t